MNTVIVTPLFPPDTSDAARYAKELAVQLDQHDLSIIAYGKLPESVSDVRIHTVSKRQSKVARTLQCLRQLRHIRPQTILLLNGPSTELPVLLYSYLYRINITYIICDHQAHQTSNKLSLWLQTRLQKRSQKCTVLPVEVVKYVPVEWHPFCGATKHLQQEQANWWQSHLRELKNI